MMKESGMPYWAFVISLFIDFIQILSFSFTLDAHFPWNAEGVVKFFGRMLDIFRMEVWLGKMGVNIYIALFYGAILLAFIVIGDFIYVAVSFSQKSFACIWPLKLLRYLCTLIVTVLFLPLIGKQINRAIHIYAKLCECKWSVSTLIIQLH